MVATEVVGEMLAFNRNAAAAPQRAAAAVERLPPGDPLDDAVEHRDGGGILEHGASRLRQPVLEKVLATELDRVEAQLAGDEIGVALIGPDELRHAKTPQRAGGRPVRVGLVGID